jgi:AcrR family transcriptional regulator
MGIKERREREREDLRTRIMDAARELIVEQGVEQVSMRKIAERIEYSPTAIYQHFADKEDLLRAMCDRDFVELNERMRARAADVTDPVEAIVLFGASYVRFAMEFPSHFRVMFMTPNAHPSEMNEEDKKKQGDPEQDGYAAFKHVIQAAIDAGRFRDEFNDAELVAQVLWGVVHGVACIQVAKQNDPWIRLIPVEQWTRISMTVALRGMLKDPADSDRVFERLSAKGGLL